MFAKRHASALVLLAAAAAFSGPLAARELPIHPRVLDEPAQLDDGSDDEAQFFSEGPFLVPERPPTGINRNWIKFGTDGCGLPDRVQSGRSMLRESGLADDMDDPDQDDADLLDDMDPVDQAWELISDLFSAEPEIAVVNDGVDKACDDEFPAFDDAEPPVIATVTILAAEDAS